MALVSIAERLADAQARHYAVPLFDTFDMKSTEGMFGAIQEKNAPCIVAIYDVFMGHPNARAFAVYIRARAEDVAQPVSLMLDHGSSFEQCMQAIAWGFTDVMYDGSKLSLEENMANTKALVRAAHAMGVAVEAELGHVGRGSDYGDQATRRKGFTDPDMVERFIAETGVDYLAIAIGTAHGLYDGDPELDMELLKEIRSRVDTPLVLHGGSGCTEDQFRTVVALGITKINVATELYVTTGKRIVAAAAEEGANYNGLGRLAVESFQERCGYYLDLFSASGKA